MIFLMFSDIIYHKFELVFYCVVARKDIFGEGGGGGGGATGLHLEAYDTLSKLMWSTAFIICMIL